MKDENSKVGGFASVNNGTINDCYSVVKFGAKRKLAGGFVAENIGHISASYSYNRLKHITGGFSGSEDTGAAPKVDDCYFLIKKKQKRQVKKLVDRDLSQQIAEIADEEDAKALGFDTENIWALESGNVPLRFIDEKWTHSTAIQSDDYIEISNEDELFDFAKKVNSGDKGAIRAKVLLTEDLNLSGEHWEPIGLSRTNAFEGVFDGGGHVIKNFVIKNREYENIGFFGFLKGEVYNLSIDCNVYGSGCIGAFVAQNIGGTIGCCAAIVGMHGKKHSLIGGFVGKNTGTVFQCYAAGRIHFIIIPIFPIVGVAAILAVTLAVTPFIKDLPVFNPVQPDPDQKPIGDVIKPNSESNYAEFEFEQKVDVDSVTGACTLHFKNPGASNHNIVVQLQFTDKQAKNILGTTGRTDAEQKKLEQTAGYDETVSRVVIAESGAINPGYQLGDLHLNSFALKNLPKGDFEATVYLIFYDIDTNNRAMLESEFPVVISVQ